MAFGLDPDLLGFKLGDVLVGLRSGTTDTPETISSTQNKLHALSYLWNPDTLSFEVATTAIASGTLAEATRIDEASGTVSYVGKAVVGAATNTSVWKISRMTTSGGSLVIEYAEGNALYDNVWDNRASLSYS